MMAGGVVGCGAVDWIVSAQNRNRCRAFVNAVKNLRVPQNAGKFLTCDTTGGLSSSTQLHRVSISGFPGLVHSLINQPTN
jgi:hypothetical protein